MKKIMFLFVILLANSISHAQTETPTPQPPTVALPLEVDVDSAFTRYLPDREAQPAASVFGGDRLQAIGRNADGLWFEVQRPGSGTRLGWIFNAMVEYEFEPWQLPITDSTTALLGSIPVEDMTGISIVVLFEAILRTEPKAASAAIVTMPINVTLPALERNGDATWVKVNYRGHVGWVAGFLIRKPRNIMDVPLAPGLPVQLFTIQIIPPEIQREELQRLREFVVVRRDMAIHLENFWYKVKWGEIMPCDPPGFVVAEYQASFRDYQELPETRRHLTRLYEGVTYLNEAISTYQPCGVYLPQEVTEAYNDAINAKIIFDVVLAELDRLEKEVIR